jgi:hypothetical protein
MYLRPAPVTVNNMPTFPTTFPTPPVSAPGPSLLDQADNSILAQFFDNFASGITGSDDFGGKSFSATGSDQEGGAGGFGMDESSFLSTISAQSFHHFMSQPSQSNGSEISGNGNSADTLAAASALFRNQQLNSPVASRLFDGLQLSPHDSHPGMGSSNGTNGMSSAAGGLAACVPAIERYSIMDPQLRSHTSALANQPTTNRPVTTDFYSTRKLDMGWAGAHNQPANLEWGSDNSFKGGSYQPPPGLPSAEQRDYEVEETVRAIQANDSSENSSPDGSKMNKDRRRKLDVDEDEGEETERPRQRRRTISKYNGASNGDSKDDEPGRITPTTSNSKRKFKSNPSADGLSINTSVTPTSASRRKASKSSPSVSGRRPPTSAGLEGSITPTNSSATPLNNGSASAISAAKAKAARENLSDAQKRENHIQSEQKRRNLIKQGFDDLCTLVPGLNAGGYSKAAVLAQTLEFLTELLDGNRALEKVLEDLGTE